MARKPNENLTGLRAWRTNTLTIPQFPLLRVGVGKAPMFESQKRMSATMVAPESHEAVSRRYVNEASGEVFTDSECEKVYDVNGSFVHLTRAELDALKSDGDKDVALVAMMRVEDVPLDFMEKAYDLWPLTKADAQGYRLIETLLASEGHVLVGTVVEDGTTKSLIVRHSALRGCLTAHVLQYSRNLRVGQAETIQTAVASVDAPDAQMVKMAQTIFDTLPTDFDFDSVEDEYAERLEAAVTAKAAGQEPPAIAHAPAVEEVPDLFAALAASVEAAKTTTAPKKARAKKSAEVVAA